jgi:hypothetical protein
MLATQFTDPRFDLRDDLMRTGRRPVGSIRERGESSRLIARDPVVDALARDAQTPGHFGHLPAVLHDGQHRLIPLFHDAQLHQHGPPPCPIEVGTRMTRVKDQPKPPSRINRIRCQPSTESVSNVR